MFEFGLGVILAVLFVTAYLLIASFFKRNRPEIGGLGRAVSLNPMDTSHALDEGRTRKALSPGESSGQSSSDANNRSGRDSS